MVGQQDIENSSQRPNMPLSPCFVYVGSALTLKVKGVPESIGKWKITALTLNVHWPNDSVDAAAFVETDGLWTATIAATATPGQVVNGIRITATGTDENGAAVDGWLLGVADLNVLDAEGQIQPGQHVDLMRIFDLAPTDPKAGDAWPTTNGLTIRTVAGDNVELLNSAGLEPMQRDIDAINAKLPPATLKTSCAASASVTMDLELVDSSGGVLKYAPHGTQPGPGMYGNGGLELVPATGATVFYNVNGQQVYAMVTTALKNFDPSQAKTTAISAGRNLVTLNFAPATVASVAYVDTGLAGKVDKVTGRGLVSISPMREGVAAESTSLGSDDGIVTATFYEYRLQQSGISVPCGQYAFTSEIPYTVNGEVDTSKLQGGTVNTWVAVDGDTILDIGINDETDGAKDTLVYIDNTANTEDVTITPDQTLTVRTPTGMTMTVSAGKEALLTLTQITATMYFATVTELESV